MGLGADASAGASTGASTDAVSACSSVAWTGNIMTEDATAKTINLNDMTGLLIRFFNRTPVNTASIAQTRGEHPAGHQPRWQQMAGSGRTVNLVKYVIFTGRLAHGNAFYLRQRGCIVNHQCAIHLPQTDQCITTVAGKLDMSRCFPQVANRKAAFA